jgi:hypothetical protein
VICLLLTEVNKASIFNICLVPLEANKRGADQERFFRFQRRGYQNWLGIEYEEEYSFYKEMR